MARLLILLFINNVISAQDTYTFKNKFPKGETATYGTESLINFEVAQGMNESGNTQTKLQKYLGYEDGFLLIEETITDIISTQKTLGKMSSDHDTNALLGIPYTIFIDTTSGKIDHLETDFGEFEEELKQIVMGMSNIENRIYPFGTGAVNVAVKESWSSPTDTLNMFPGESDEVQNMYIDSEYTFDKIKVKKGVNIAYLTSKHRCRADLEWIQDNTLFTGEIDGTIKVKHRYNLDDKYVIWEKSSGNLGWKMAFEGEQINASLNITSKTKRAK